MKNILSKYRNKSNGTALNVAQNIVIDGQDTNIPLNVPTFIVAAKNGGKSTLISTLINAEKVNNVYKRIIYIYTDHVDSTLADQCHVQILRIPLDHSIEFIRTYFKRKSEFISWTKFLDVNLKNGLINTALNPKDEKIKLSDLTTQYTDNIIDSYVNNCIEDKSKYNAQDFEAEAEPGHSPATQKPKPLNANLKALSPASQILEYAKHFLTKYSKNFKIVVENTTYHIEGLLYNQYDQLIIDDVGVAASYLFPHSVDKSPLYRYLTITRHIMLGIIIAGQDIMQLPLYARKEMNTFVLGVGLDINTIANTNILKNKQKEIIGDYPSVKPFDFLIYNGINQSLTYLSL